MAHTLTRPVLKGAVSQIQFPRPILRSPLCVKSKVKYRPLSILGEGVFGVVFSSFDQDGRLVAVKKVKQDPKFKNRELWILKQLCSPYIISLKNYTTEPIEGESSFYLFIVTEIMPCSLGKYIKNCRRSMTPVPIDDLRQYCFQLFSALDHIHSLGIVHRDIKPDNILIDPVKKVIKLCDFGSAKVIDENTTSVSYIASRNYRAPELLLNCVKYNHSIDIWAAGCVIAEILRDDQPMFQGADNADLLREIIKILGNPTEEDLNSFQHELQPPQGVEQIANLEVALPLRTDPDLLHLLKQIFVFNPSKRPTAAECLRSSFFSKVL